MADTFTMSINTMENIKEAQSYENIEEYLEKYVGKYNEFRHWDSAGEWVCYISKEEDCKIYKLKVIINYAINYRSDDVSGGFERYYSYNSLNDLFMNKFLNIASHYKLFKANCNTCEKN
jgi:hypothetical protein